MHCIACNYRLDPTTRRCSECGSAFDPSDPGSYLADADQRRGRPAVCLLVALVGGGAVLLIVHALTVLWPSLGGFRGAIITAAVAAALVAAASAVRNGILEALALAAGAALGLVGMFVVSGWILAGAIHMPARWVLWAVPAVLVAYGSIALVAAAAGRTIRRRRSRATPKPA